MEKKTEMFRRIPGSLLVLFFSFFFCSAAHSNLFSLDIELISVLVIFWQSHKLFHSHSSTDIYIDMLRE